MFKSSHLQISSYEISDILPKVFIDDVNFLYSDWKFHNIHTNMINCNASLLLLEANTCNRNSSLANFTSTINIQNCTLGGGWKFQCIEYVQISDCSITSDSSFHNNIIMNFTNSSAILYNVLIKGASFICEEEMCGMIANQFSKVEIKNSIYQNNKNASIFVFNGSMLMMENCIVSDNEVNSGIIYGVKSIVSIAKCLFQHNTGLLAGTIYAREYSVLTVKNSIFTQNRGTGNASVIAINTYGNVSILNTNITSNNVITNVRLQNQPVYGTVVCRHFCFLHIDNCIFIDNNGSSVLTSQNSDLVIINSRFKNNTAHVGGGVFGIRNSKGNISHSIFEGNIAVKAVAIYIGDCSFLICAKSNFSKNLATGLNTIEVNNQSNATLSHLIVNQNHGVGTSFYGSTFINIYKCMFNKNAGVAIFASQVTTLVVEKSDFLNNKGVNGGANMIFGADNITVTNPLIMMMVH